MKKLTGLILAVITFISLMTVPTQAAVHSYPLQYLEVDLPDTVLIITQDTSTYDEVWTAAGISDPSAKLEEFENMGVVAYFYDTASKQAVSFIYNKTSETVETFHFKDMSDAEIIAYVEALMTPDENVNISVSAYPHSQTGFFRMELKVNNIETTATEVIYGTIMNGQMLQFDVYQTNLNPVDETFVKQVIDNIRFTKILTREEYEAEVSRSFKILITFVVCVIALIVLLIVLSKRRRAHELKVSKTISDKMQNFRERRRAGEVNLSEAARFAASTVYDEAMLNDYTIFNTWIRGIAKVAVWGIIFVAILVLTFMSGNTTYTIIFALIGATLVYYLHNLSEKKKAALVKQYEAKSKHEASFKFYSEYFTMSGIGSISEYIYEQITSVRTYKNYIILYMTAEHSVIIDKEHFSVGTPEEFIAYVKQNMTK